jgi:hypothetical protein
VNRVGFRPGGFRDASGGFAGRGTQNNVFTFKAANDSPDDCGLSGSGSARDEATVADNRKFDGFDLLFR